MVSREDLPYRDCVGVAVFNREGKVFIARRLQEGDPEETAVHGSPWQMPQGGIDKGEAPAETARRELFEETSIRSIQQLDELRDWVYYDIPDDIVAEGGLKGKYRGQRQRWLAFLFTGEDNEINVATPGNGNEAEFDRWRWEDLARLPQLIVPFKRQAYEQVCAAFAHLPAQVRGGR